MMLCVSMTGDVRRDLGRESVGRGVWTFSRVPRGVLASDSPSNSCCRPACHAAVSVSYGDDRFSADSQHVEHDRGRRRWHAAADDDNDDDIGGGRDDGRWSPAARLTSAKVSSRLDQLHGAGAPSCRLASAVAVCRRRRRAARLAILWSGQVRTSRRRWIRRWWSSVRVPAGPPRLPAAPCRAEHVRQPPRTAVIIARRLRLRHRRRRRRPSVRLPVATGRRRASRRAAWPARRRRRTVQQRRRSRSAASQSRAVAPRVEGELSPLPVHGRRQHRHLTDWLATLVFLHLASVTHCSSAPVCPVPSTCMWGIECREWVIVSTETGQTDVRLQRGRATVDTSHTVLLGRIRFFSVAVAVAVSVSRRYTAHQTVSALWFLTCHWSIRPVASLPIGHLGTCPLPLKSPRFYFPRLSHLPVTQTQRACMDADVKHLDVRIFLLTTV